MIISAMLDRQSRFKTWSVNVPQISCKLSGLGELLLKAPPVGLNEQTDGYSISGNVDHHLVVGFRINGGA